MFSDLWVNNFRCHVIRCTQAQFQWFWVLLEWRSKTEVCYFDARLLRIGRISILQKDIVRLQIPMHDSARMDKVYGEAELFYDVASFVLIASISPCDNFGERFRQEFHRAVDIVPVFKKLHHANYVLMVRRLDYFYLTLEQFIVIFCWCNLAFVDDFYSTDCICPSVLSDPDWAETPLTQHVTQLIIVSNVRHFPEIVEAGRPIFQRGNARHFPLTAPPLQMRYLVTALAYCTHLFFLSRF